VLVQVPVIVEDEQGNHVHGLAKEDFEVFEDSKPQKVSVFEEFIAAPNRVMPANTPANTFTNRFGAPDRPHSVIVFVLDSVNTPFLDQAYGRRELIRYLANNLDPDQTFALISLGRNRVRMLHGITQDPAALVQVLKKLGGEIPAMQGVDTDTQALAATSALGNASSAPTGSLLNPAGGSYFDLEDWVMNGEAEIAKLQQDQAIESTMRGFLDVAWAVSGIPGRKAVIWATGGFPFYIDSPGAVPGGYLSTLYERAMQMMNDAEISVYPVDVRGLLNSSPAADATARLRSGLAASQQLVARNWLFGSTIDTLRDFADMTGGRAFYNTNDIANSFHRAAADSASYYLLSYYLDTNNRSPGWRTLKVRVHRKDTDVRARNGFFVTNATVNWELSRKIDLGFAMYSPFDSTGIPMSVQWTDTSVTNATPSEAEKQNATSDNKKKLGFLVRIDGTGISLGSGAPHKL
jgi:VWFA-related protein